MTDKNGTVSALLLREKPSGKWVWAVVHTDRDGEVDLLGEGYANLDEAKSAAWHAAKSLNAVAVPTKGRAR